MQDIRAALLPAFIMWPIPLNPIACGVLDVDADIRDLPNASPDGHVEVDRKCEDLFAHGEERDYNMEALFGDSDPMNIVDVAASREPAAAQVSCSPSWDDSDVPNSAHRNVDGPHTSHLLSMGTDFSGLETPSMAMRMLGIDHRLVCASEREVHLRRFIAANFNPSHLYKNALGGVPHDLDLYIAGPPCIRFSVEGTQMGEPDPSTSTMECSVRRIISEKPKLFVVENVLGLKSFDGGAFFKGLLCRLEAEGYYRVSWRILNTKHFGLPQSRRRIYITGIASSLAVGTPCFTKYVEPHAPQLVDYLDAPEADDCCDRLPPLSQRIARTNVVFEIARLRTLGLDPSSPDRILDADSSTGRSPRSRTYSPCLTHSRSQGLWLLSRGRRMRMCETLALQGIEYRNWRWDMTDQQAIAAAGNAMSVQVLTAVISEVLACSAHSEGTSSAASGLGEAEPTHTTRIIAPMLTVNVKPERKRWRSGSLGTP